MDRSDCDADNGDRSSTFTTSMPGLGCAVTKASKELVVSIINIGWCSKVIAHPFPSLVPSKRFRKTQASRPNQPHYPFANHSLSHTNDPKVAVACDSLCVAVPYQVDDLPIAIDPFILSEAFRSGVIDKIKTDASGTEAETQRAQAFARRTTTSVWQTVVWTLSKPFSLLGVSNSHLQRVCKRRCDVRVQDS